MTILPPRPLPPLRAWPVVMSTARVICEVLVIFIVAGALCLAALLGMLP